MKLSVDLVWKLKLNPVCTRECLDHNFSHEKARDTTTMVRTVWLSFGR